MNQQNQHQESANNLVLSTDFLEKTISDWLAKRFTLTIDRIDPNSAFVDYGLDSILAAQMLNTLETYIKKPLESYLIKDYPTIAALAKFLANAATNSITAQTNISKTKSYNDYLLPQNSELNKSEIAIPELV